MPYVLTVRRRSIFEKFAVGVLLHQRTWGHQLQCGLRLFATVTAAVPQSLVKSTTLVSIDGLKAKALIGSGSSESFIHPELVKSAALHICPSSNTISMAASSLAMKVTGHCFADLLLEGRTYNKVRLSVLPDLCTDLILGFDFQSRHDSVVFKHGGPNPSLSICGVSTLNTDPPQLFANLTDDCHPIATKSRKYCRDDLAFINSEVKRLLEEGIIEPSKLPWRAQVVVTKGENHKKRMVIDYSQIINRFTRLDAFPLPRISDMINDIAQYRVFSTIDLQSAYHQIPLRKEREALYCIRGLQWVMSIHSCSLRCH